MRGEIWSSKNVANFGSNFSRFEISKTRAPRAANLHCFVARVLVFLTLGGCNSGRNTPTPFPKSLGRNRSRQFCARGPLQNPKFCTRRVRFVFRKSAKFLGNLVGAFRPELHPPRCQGRRARSRPFIIRKARATPQTKELISYAAH